MKKINVKILFFLLSVFIVLIIFWWHYLNQEKYIYFWDNVNYWDRWQNLVHLFRTNFSEGIKQIIYSIRYEAYTDFPTIFILPWALLFGESRITFILSLVTTFALPVIAVTYAVLKKFIKKISNNQTLFKFILILFLILLPQLWIPITWGMPDIGGLFFIWLIVWLYFRKNLLNQQYKTLFIISLLLLFLIFFRRWYAFWITAFFISIGVSEIITSWKKGLVVCKKIIFRLLLIGIIWLGLLFLLASPLAESLFINYGDLYAGYRTLNNIFSHLISLFYYFGPLSIILALFGLYLELFKLKKILKLSLFFMINFLVVFVLFTRTQDFSIQHYYLITPTIIYFNALAINWIVNKTTQSIQKVAVTSIIILLELGGFATMFIPGVKARLGFLSEIYSVNTFYPMVRNDLNQIDNLLMNLNILVKETRGTIYTLASSIYLNSDILGRRCRYLYTNNQDSLCHYLTVTNDIDSRDGIPNQFFKATYVVLQDPVGYHNLPSTQQVVGYFAEKIINQEDFGKYFTQIAGGYFLDDKGEVKIYKKITEFTQSDLELIQNYFFQIYPDNKEKFTIDF